MHEVNFPLSADAAAERGTFWLVDGLIYTDCFYQHLLLKGVLHVVETTLSFLFISWSSGDTCSCVAMAMEEEFFFSPLLLTHTHAYAHMQAQTHTHLDLSYIGRPQLYSRTLSTLGTVV